MEQYYLALFTRDSWREFLNSGGKIYGTRQSQKSRSFNVHKNDYLICYITRVSCFVGVLKVKSDYYVDETPIWSNEIFPLRFDVELIESTKIDKCISVNDIRKDLLIFKKLKDTNRWTGFFMRPFSQFSTEDAKFIINKIKESNL